MPVEQLLGIGSAIELRLYAADSNSASNQQRVKAVSSMPHSKLPGHVDTPINGTGFSVKMSNKVILSIGAAFISALAAYAPVKDAWSGVTPHKRQIAPPGIEESDAQTVEILDKIEQLARDQDKLEERLDKRFDHLENRVDRIAGSKVP